MIYTNDLKELVFNRHESISKTDALTVLSGYVGPAPVQLLDTLPFRVKVIYGMYGSDGIRPSLHGALVSVHKKARNVEVYYSKMPIHAKCYAWQLKSEVVYALIGSANFSTNGLNSAHREILAETNRDSFSALKEYIQHVLNNSISCLEADSATAPNTQPQTASVCRMTLLDRSGKVQECAGLNWGQNPKNHTHPSDAYIKISTQDVRDFPLLFPPKQEKPLRFDGRGRAHRHNDAIEIIWDDGVTMEGLLMGSQNVDGVKHPKQIMSFPTAQHMGRYLRSRLGVPPESPVRKHHLDRYGRTDIEVTLAGEGVYYFDFSSR